VSDVNEAAPQPRENPGAALPRIDGRLKLSGEARTLPMFRLPNWRTPCWSPATWRAARSLGADFVKLRIHERTRELRVPPLLGAFAAGRATRTARSQLMDGLVRGMSAAHGDVGEVQLLLPKSTRAAIRRASRDSASR